jgi:L-alanine-DL-glutamate epimerase-like enolase superfamily enzyme
VKIVALTAYHVTVPLRRPIRHASHSRESTDNLVVRCRLDDGTVGHGEGVPRDYVTGETIDSAIALLQESRPAEQFEPCDGLAAVVTQAERFRLAPRPGDARGIGGNAARCAVELAVQDAAGRRFGEPLSSVIRLAAPDLYSPRPEVRYSGAITSARGLKLRLVSWLQRFYGLAQIKVKVGIAGQDDVKRLATVRRCAGAKMDLRVDANEAWSPGEVVARIRELLPFRITSVEQPVAHEKADCLSDVRKQVNVPIMLDESLCGEHDAEVAITRGTCDLFNVRLSKCGGLLPSLRLVRMARQAGLGCQLGCQVGETAILSTAGRHFATSVKDLRYLEGSYDRHLVQYMLGNEDVTFGWGGWAPALVRTGLGIGVQEDVVERLALRKETLIG